MRHLLLGIIAALVLTGSAPSAVAQDKHPANWNMMNAQQQAWWLCRDDPARITDRCKMVPKETAVQTVPPVTAAPDKSQAGSLLRIGTGTAFVVGQNLIATNFHVIDGGTAWELRFPSTNEAWPLELVVADKANDLVVMRVKGAMSPLKPLSVVAARTAKLGEEVYTVGFPLTGIGVSP